MATFYVIRHKATHELMPEVHTGYTHWKPGQENSRRSPIPRLFISEKKAKAALRSYLQGEFAWVPVHSGGISLTFVDKRKRINPRNPDDFEVLEMRLIDPLKEG